MGNRISALVAKGANCANNLKKKCSYREMPSNYFDDDTDWMIQSKNLTWIHLIFSQVTFHCIIFPFLYAELSIS